MDIDIIDTSRRIGLIDNKPKGNTIMKTMKTFEVTLSERCSVTRTVEAASEQEAEEVVLSEHNEGGLDFTYYDELECNAKESAI